MRRITLCFLALAVTASLRVAASAQDASAGTGQSQSHTMGTSRTCKGEIMDAPCAKAVLMMP